MNKYDNIIPIPKKVRKLMKTNIKLLNRNFLLIEPKQETKPFKENFSFQDT